jgi:polyisoprenoid-binding protein YceI
MKIKQFAFYIGLLGVLAFKLIQGWNIEPTYKVSFSIGYWAGTCDGSIEGLKGNINFDANDPGKSVVNLGMDLNTLKTGNGTRDSHLKKEEYFDVAKYPFIIFKSTGFSKTAGGYLVEGNLSIKATTKKIQIPFTFTETGTDGIFKARFKINRVDYKVSESSWKLKDTVTINVSIPVKKL